MSTVPSKEVCVGDIEFILPIYKKVSVPIYSHPTPSEVMKIREKLFAICGNVKKVKSILRTSYRCFMSENVMWRARVHSVHVDGYAEPPVPVVPTLINVMVRTLVPAPAVIDALRKFGVSINPYSSPPESTNACLGFYTKSFEHVEQVVDELGRAGLISDAMIVNAVWYMRLGRFINLLTLVSTGIFVYAASKFKCVTGTIEDSKVTIFNTGTVRIMRAPRPDIAKSIAGKVYYVLIASNAII